MVAVLASCGGERISLWNVPGDAIPVSSFTPQSIADASSESAMVTSLCWSKSAQILAASTACGIISIYSQSGHLQDSLRPDPIIGSGSREVPTSCITFSSNALSICGGGADRTLRLWDCKRREIVKLFQGHRSAISCIAFSDRDEGLLSGSLCGDLLLHNVASGSAVTLCAPTESGPSKPLNAVQFSPFKKTVAGVAGEDAVVQLWDTNRGVAVSQFTQHKAAVKGISFSPVNELLLCSAGMDKLLLFYDVQTNKLVKTISCEAPLESLDFMNDGFTVAAGTSTGHIVVYDLRTLGSGASQALSFSAHAPLPVTSLQFQHAPSSRGRGKPRQVGKENTQPQDVSASSSGAHGSAGRLQSRTVAADTSSQVPPEADTLRSSTGHRTSQAPGNSDAQSVVQGSSRDVHAGLATSAQSSAIFSPASREHVSWSPAEGALTRDKLDKQRSSVETSARKSAAHEIYSASAHRDGAMALPVSKDSSLPVRKSIDRSPDELLQEIERIRQERSQLVRDPSKLTAARGPDLSGKDSTSSSSHDSNSAPADVAQRGGALLSPARTTATSIPNSGTFSAFAASHHVTAESSSIHRPENVKVASSHQQQQAALGTSGSGSRTIRSPTSHTPDNLVSLMIPESDHFFKADVLHKSKPSSGHSDGRNYGFKDDLHNPEKGGDLSSAARTQRPTQPADVLAEHQSSFPRELLPLVKSLLEDSMESFRESVRADIQNMHVDMLRQFHLQQRELKEELAAYAATNTELREEINNLREQTRLLSYLH